MFFDEFSSLLDELVAGDFNIRLDRPDDHHSTQLLDVLNVMSTDRPTTAAEFSTS